MWKVENPSKWNRRTKISSQTPVFVACARMRVEFQLISQRVILTFSQSRYQMLLSFWSALRITNQLFWITVTQALRRECRFPTFLCGQSKTHQNSSVDANRSMRFRWQRKRILSKKHQCKWGLNLILLGESIGNHISSTLKPQTWDNCFTYVSHLLHEVSEVGSL